MKTTPRSAYDTPTAQAIVTLKSADASNADIQRAAAHVLDVVDVMLRKSIARKVHRNPLINRIYEYDDIVQESRCLVLTQVVSKIDLSQAGADDYLVRRLLGGFTRLLVLNFWRDKIRHVERNGTLQPVHEQSINKNGHRADRPDGHGADNYCDTLLGGREDDDRHEDIFDRLRCLLAPQDFDICCLRYQGLSTTEIGQRVGMSRKGVQDRIRFKVRPVLGPMLAASGMTVPA